MRIIQLAAAAVAISILGFSTAALGEPLKPLQPWVVNYAATECNAQREYGDSADPIYLGLVPSAWGNTFELFVATKGLGPQSAEELEGSVDFGHGPVKAWLLHYGTYKPKRLNFYRFRISTGEIAQATSAALVTFHVKNHPDFVFTLEVIPELLKNSPCLHHGPSALLEHDARRAEEYCGPCRGRGSECLQPFRLSGRSDVARPGRPGPVPVAHRRTGQGSSLRRIEPERHPRAGWKGLPGHSGASEVQAGDGPRRKICPKLLCHSARGLVDEMICQIIGRGLTRKAGAQRLLTPRSLGGSEARRQLQAGARRPWPRANSSRRLRAAPPR